MLYIFKRNALRTYTLATQILCPLLCSLFAFCFLLFF